MDREKHQSSPLIKGDKWFNHSGSKISIDITDHCIVTQDDRGYDKGGIYSGIRENNKGLLI